MKRPSKKAVDKLVELCARNMMAEREGWEWKQQQKAYLDYMKALQNFEKKYLDGQTISEKNKDALEKKAQEFIDRQVIRGPSKFY